MFFVYQLRTLFFATLPFLWVSHIFCQDLIDEGLSYQLIETEIPQKIHILKIDPSRFKIFPVRALDNEIGKESVLSLCQRKEALAAINGGFFQVGGKLDGLPSGILRIESKWYSLPSLKAFGPARVAARGAIGWKEDSSIVFFDRLSGACFLDVNGHFFPVDGLNRPRKEGEAILYSSSFHKTTFTDPGGIEALIAKGEVQSIEKSSNSSIPADGWVLSLNCPKDISHFPFFLEKEAKVKIDFQLFPQIDPSKDWMEMEHIVGGAGLLIIDGKIVTDFYQEQTRASFISKRFARTAVGILPNDDWLFVVVDGVERGVSEGMTIRELALLMKRLGCKNALNLDGGRSSTLVIGKKVINSPTGDEDEYNGKKRLRKVSDAILVVKKDHSTP